jgi:Ribosomal protein L6P/L9E
MIYPDNIKITVEKQTILKISGGDKQEVGTVASKIKSFRPPEPYKGKGIKEKGQYILRKEGKKK